MNGDMIIHAVEVKSYTRVLPNGKTITVKGYSRKGNAFEDEMRRKDVKVTVAQNRRANAERRMDQEYHRNKQEQSNPKANTSEYMRKRINQASLNKFNQAANEYLDADRAVNEARAEYYHTYDSRNKIENVIKYMATDAYEEVQVAVGNIIEGAKEKVLTIGAHLENAAEEVKKTVTSGWNAVAGFFKGLFGGR